MVKRIYCEKRNEFDVEAKKLLTELKESLLIENLELIRAFKRYDIEGISEDEYKLSKHTIFSEPPVDIVYDESLPELSQGRLFAIEYLPGQYDQRADSASQCVQILTAGESPLVRTAKIIFLKGGISGAEFEKIKSYLINPLEAREASLNKPDSLVQNEIKVDDVKVVDGFTKMSLSELNDMKREWGFAMSNEDLAFCQDYFRKIDRNPTVTELRMIDTYWSDHCRHTTFLTTITDVKIEDGNLSNPIKNAYQLYLDMRKTVYGEKDRDQCLMDMAVIGMKELRKRGLLEDLDKSEEINACSINVTANINGEAQDWLVMFKNETHNHPTEIEPFGGAATCLGGAIRDPLSGRVYVYQAMRVTGSADPRTSIEDTTPGKLPQRKITTGAANGYSSYGNQIGLATGQVAEVYHEGYVAKRMEIGAVVGAAPKENVVRERPIAGDVIVLLGGRTGRDGCGGATGSSKEHNEDSLMSCGAEVQKGNPPTERKIQRLFRDPQVSKMIKRCNDFGAGGVSVAIGELADGLIINLDAVPKKYEGLDGTELAISESQERMAVVLSKEDMVSFIKAAEMENLEAVEVAVVTEEPRLKMLWRGTQIVDIERSFLDTNGVNQSTDVYVSTPKLTNEFFVDEAYGKISEKLRNTLSDLNSCSQKGLVEKFDSTIGASTVLLPFGGLRQLTPTDGMVAKLPVLEGETSTVTMMSYGFDPYLSSLSPFHGAMYAVLHSVAKIAAIGGDIGKVRLTLQEYFEKLGKDAVKWGKPFSALLGALWAQNALKVPAIGGKDSMSGTFMDITVPPTLVSFALVVGETEDVISQELKEAGNKLVYLPISKDKDLMPDFAGFVKTCDAINKMHKAGLVKAASTIKNDGALACITKMAFGNEIGVNFINDKIQLFAPDYGSFIVEVKDGFETYLENVDYKVVAQTIDSPYIQIKNEEISLKDLIDVWQKPLSKVFPEKVVTTKENCETFEYKTKTVYKTNLKIAKPRVVIPVFPGTNCEYDTKRAFEKAGAVADIFVINNLSAKHIEASMRDLAKSINNSQIVMLPGGFSGGDEPDGSGKFIATAFRNPYVKDAVNDLLKNRDGLMLGICNGFQALIKLGLVPYGEIRDIDEECPTLTFNTIGRHVSCMVDTKISSNISPWFNNVKVGDIHTIPVSHGEGRFVASEALVKELALRGQVATQYVNKEGNPTMEMPFNPNGSMYSIEGISSPDGRVLGKMGHSERVGNFVANNVPGEKDQKLFTAGVAYFG